ncbi:unnamed protein product [Lymnaea stagnalis]|uniref:C-type lectin domain-containing protein n=1 Tax=Lymnaea stagnalis TaxID=6523 RepID=A0AAV2IGS2_LYMST
MFCNLRGGYLVEIETKKEFDFLKGFIEPLVKEHKFLLTGGTKSAERSSWSYFESEKPISFFHWATREQPASAEPGVCIWLWRDGDWSYVEGVCDFNSYTGNERGFLCEIPQ